MENIVVHWELGSHDPESLGRFYADLFGWRIEPQETMDYRVAYTRSERGINGGIMQIDEEVPAYLVFYVVVEDLQATLDLAQSLGAKTVFPPTPIPGVGTFAHISDPQGFLIGAIEPPPDWNEQAAEQQRKEEGGYPVIHWEIGSGDPAELHAFYTALFGWQIDTDTPMNYPMVLTGGEGGINGGIYEAEDPDHRFLTIYVQVEDVAATLKQAGRLGASYVGEIASVPEIGEFSIVGDPEGRFIGIMQES